MRLLYWNADYSALQSNRCVKTQLGVTQIENGVSVDPFIAELTFREVQAGLSRARLRIATVPFVLVAFAVVDLIAGQVALRVGRDHLLAYFVPAQICAFVVSLMNYRRTARRSVRGTLDAQAFGSVTPIWP